MGQAESKVNTEIINENEFNIDQSTRNNIQSSCMSNQAQENILQIVGSKVRNLRTDQSNIAKNLCKLQTMIDDTRGTTLQNDILNQLTQQIEAKGGLPGTGGKAESITKMYNKMTANLDQSTINNITKDCIMKQDQRNVIQIFGSDVADSNLSQVNSAFVECLQGYEDIKKLDSGLANTAKAELEQSVKSSAMDPFASFASLAISGLPFFIPILISLCCCLVILSSLFGGGSGGGGSGSDTTTVYSTSYDQPPPYY